MFKCYYCQEDLIWNNDFNSEEVGYIPDGIVSYYTCSNKDCSAQYEIFKYNGSLYEE